MATKKDSKKASPKKRSRVKSAKMRIVKPNKKFKARSRLNSVGRLAEILLTAAIVEGGIPPVGAGSRGLVRKAYLLAEDFVSEGERNLKALEKRK